MAIWICDKHKVAGAMRSWNFENNKERLFGSNDSNKDCEVRIVSDDNALALGWKRLDY